MDLRAAVPDDRPLLILPGKRALVPTGLVLEIPEGFEGQIRPRSGLAFKHGITCLNTPGTIDSDYRGEVKVLLINLGDEDFSVTRGMRIAQIVFAPVTQATRRGAQPGRGTTRGAGGFGSTGTADVRRQSSSSSTATAFSSTPRTLANRRLSEWLTEAGYPDQLRALPQAFLRPQPGVGAEGGRGDRRQPRRRISSSAGIADLPDLFADGVEAIPHVEDFIEAVQTAGIASCVASSARVDKMH